MSTIRSYLKNNNTSIFPERIMYFYSGANNKANGSFKLVNSRYVKACRDSITQYWNTVYLLNHEYTSQFPKRKYNFFREELTPIYLVSILAGEDSFEKSYLHSRCHIEQCRKCLDFPGPGQASRSSPRRCLRSWKRRRLRNHLVY